MSSKLSLIIASFQDPCGLYLSTFAALQQLEKSNLEFEIILSCDGGTSSKWEAAHPNIKVLRMTGGNRTGSPQGTRDAGLRAAQYNNVMFIDSHVIVSDMEKWTELHEQLGATLSFPAMVGGSLDMWKLYGSVFDFDGSFWNKRVLYQPKSAQPYRIAQSSHSGFMTDRDFYLQTGGYTDLLKGYGAEESLLGLKAWMLGGQNWMVPEIWHSHYQPAGRNEGAEYTENYKKNFILTAYVCGGEKYKKQAEEYYKEKLKITPEIEAERQRICASPYNGDLDLLREYFKTEGIE